MTLSFDSNYRLSNAENKFFNLNFRISINILSNKSDEATRQIVAELLPGWRFNNVLGATAAIPKKPDPTAALNIAEQCGVAPGETLFMGDTAIDMQTARACGMYSVGVL
jgi:phosphoglycolate phosphatase